MTKNSTAIDNVVMVILCLSGIRSFSSRKVHAAFRNLSKNESFKNLLFGLDFDCLYGQFYSDRLDNILSMFGTAGVLHHSNPRYYDYFIPQESITYAERILASQSATDQALLKRASVTFRQLMKE